MSTHTPGPWKHYGESVWSEHKSVSGKETRGARTNHVCAISSRLKIPNAEREANAALIAAAPELLEALEKTEAWVSQYTTLKGHESPAETMLTVIRAAIVKAKGV